VAGLPAFGRGSSPGGNSEAGFRARLRTNREKEIKTMNATAMQAILWIVAGFFLTLLIIRRGKRKASRN
jgi:hypothetical protein